jgi:serine/threonine-protein kinase
VLRQVCLSLAEAHARGFVHRDIKPANILICRYGLEVDHVKVLDFGIVKPMDAGLMANVALTQQGQISGTPNFLAPEQARGLDEIDGRADLYSLGCVAYWLLTGQRLFPQETAIGQIVAHASQLPDRVSAHAEVPAALDEIVARCLAKHPEERFPDAAALEAALAAVPLARPWTQAEAKEFWDARLVSTATADHPAVRPTDGPRPAVGG